MLPLPPNENPGYAPAEPESKTHIDIHAGVLKHISCAFLHELDNFRVVGDAVSDLVEMGKEIGEQILVALGEVVERLPGLIHPDCSICPANIEEKNIYFIGKKCIKLKL